MLAGGVGLLAVLWVFPYLARVADGDWMARHSELGRWEYTQDRIRRFDWYHDDFGPVGKYGGKDWAEWIMRRLPGEEDQWSCASGHKTSALESITNYSPGGERGKWPQDLPLWLAWWEQNRSKTQDQWIVDGFAAEGVVIHHPPAEEDWPTLLKVLGHVNPKDDKPAQEGDRIQPECFKYNAFRCLRDSEFNPVQYAMEAEITPEVKAGLLLYRRLEQGRDYWGNPPGRLFGAGDGETYYRAAAIPGVLEPTFRWGWGSASALACVAGVWLWRRKSRRVFPLPG